MDEKRDKALMRRGQMVALVIAATMVLWLAVNFFGAAVGLPGRYTLLADFAALAALFWAMVVTFQIWQARRADER